MKNVKTVITLAAVLTLSACGSAADDFVGLWSQTGTVTFAANGQSSTNPLSGNQRISRGTGPEEIVLAGDCVLRATVNGNVATVPSGLSCTTHNSTGTMVTTYRTGTLSRSEDSIVFTGSGDILVMANGASVSVAFTLTNTLNRIGE